MTVSSAIPILSLIILNNAAVTSGIVGGKPSKPFEVPYQVSLQVAESGLHFCGGAILNEHYVITAAHCVEDVPPELIVIVAGTSNLQTQGSTHLVENIYVHENYNRSNFYINDIALVKVTYPSLRSTKTAFVPMPQPGEITETNDQATVFGFGKFEGKAAILLHYLNIRVVNHTYCNELYRNIIYDTQFCAYDPSGLKGHRHGDSGGPTIIKGKLHGIVSWAHKKIDLYPSVYTRVSSYLEWIQEHAV